MRATWFLFHPLLILLTAFPRCSYTMANLMLVVTGASRGLGRAIAKAFSREVSHIFPNTSKVFVHLIARSSEGLDGTEQEILTQISDRKAWNIEIVKHQVDLSDLDKLDDILVLIFEAMRSRIIQCDRIVFVNNAGSLGVLGPCLESPSLKDMQRTVDFNVTSSLWTSVRFIRNVKIDAPEATTTIVNISSLAAIQPLPTMGIYSAGKAARDSYHAVLAKELKNTGSIKILNYAPGPLETDMTNALRAEERLDADLKPHFQKQLIDPNDSAVVLVKLVMDNDFESGTHIDYYDVNAA